MVYHVASCCWLGMGFLDFSGVKNVLSLIILNKKDINKCITALTGYKYSLLDYMPLDYYCKAYVFSKILMCSECSSFC